MRFILKLLITTVVLIFCCAFPAMAGEVNLSIAASLKDVINELVTAYSKDHPGTGFVSNFGASGSLAKQIESGAPADLYISADPDWMNYLAGKQLIVPATIGIFAYNSLVFVGMPGRAATLSDLTKLEKIAIGSPKSVPAGAYAMQALKKAGLAKNLESKLVMAKDVRECLLYAERGEVDGAFVYRTDALLAKTVGTLFSVPQELYPRVAYPVALTVMGAQHPDVSAFLGYIRGPAGSAMLEKYGFGVP